MAIPIAVMGAIAAAAGAATAAGSSAIASKKSGQLNSAADDLIGAQRTKNKQWYDQQMSEDYIQRSDAQAILKKQRELLDEHYKRARATNVVAGGTDESLALQQQAANKSLSDTASNIASQASSHKDKIEEQYRNSEDAYVQQMVEQYFKRANNVAQAGSQGVSAGLGLMSTGLSAMIGK